MTDGKQERFQSLELSILLFTTVEATALLELHAFCESTGDSQTGFWLKTAKSLAQKMLAIKSMLNQRNLPTCNCQRT
ncbi:MAG TPA: hypothetical protein IGS53_09280 [Leptolyngbyaceae cyanobacterium M33_DOE_097]|nr:hypothetical protein [Leptolyngbyaceae cyanobacterium M33_DOE_097]